MSLSDFNTIVSLLVLVITWLIVQPLKTDIATIKASSEKVCSIVEQLRKEIGKNNEETVRVGESAKSAHKRIDRLEERVIRVESRCEHCTMQKNGKEHE